MQAKEILQKGIEKSLEEHKVPFHIHLKVVDALKKEMAQHSADLNLTHVLMNRHALQLKEHDEMSKKEREIHNAQLKAYNMQIAHIASTDWTGAPGKDAEPVDIESLVEEILSRIPMPQDGYTPKKGVDYFDGIPGKDAEEQKVVERIITKIQKEKVLDVSHIRNAESFLFNTGQKKIKVMFEELMHGAGSTSSGGNTFQIPTSGAVNGSNQIFVWATVPNVIVVDQGRPMQRISSDGTINWTAVGTTTTLSIAPNFDIFSTN